MNNVLSVQHLTPPPFSSNRDHQHYLYHYLILDEHPIAVCSSLGSMEDLSSFSPVLKDMMQFYELKLYYSQTRVGMRKYLNVNSSRFLNLNLSPQLVLDINSHDTSNEFDKVPILFSGRYQQ